MQESEVSKISFRVSANRSLKEHSQLLDRADLDTTFASLKNVYLILKSNVRVGCV